LKYKFSFARALEIGLGFSLGFFFYELLKLIFVVIMT